VARLVAGHDREVACERELEQAEFDAIDDEGRRHRVSLGNPPHQLGAVAAFLKLAARRGNTDFSAETISAAMTGSGYSVELSAALLAELKAAGHYDDILAEAAAAGPAE
jgi:formate hydrogenlyase subunit 4